MCFVRTHKSLGQELKYLGRRSKTQGSTFGGNMRHTQETSFFHSASLTYVGIRPLAAPPSLFFFSRPHRMASFLHPLIVSELNNLYNLIVFLVLTETTTAAIERRLYRPPLPQLSSIATVKHQRQPSSITAVKH